jgi:hypothetical protein
MISFPRSGNTLLRAYLEKIMGLHTGSGGSPKDKMIIQLKNGGFNGETITDKRVIVVKTHSPERVGRGAFDAERAILLVRSPLDALTSEFNIMATGTHDLSISDADLRRKIDVFNEFIEQEITVWRDFHEFWLKKSSVIPFHIVRYEDLMNNPESVLKPLIEFVINRGDISGTKIEQYIKIAV